MSNNKKQQNRITKLRKQAKQASLKKVIMFDLDGTLAKSKANLDEEMSSLLCALLDKKKVGVMGGGSYAQFTDQFLEHLQCSQVQLKNLFILPLSGGSLYTYQVHKCKRMYHHLFSVKEKAKITDAFKKAFRDINYTKPTKIYGKVIEDRGSQMTFSALGQKASLSKKSVWNEKSDIRPQLKSALEKYLLDFEVRLGGLTSIDVTRKGIDKAYGIEQVMKSLSVDRKEIVYIGDALYKGGNDYAAKRAGTATVEVKDVEETKIFIRSIFLSLNND